MTYDELSSLLTGLDSRCGPAEAHGLLLASICAAGPGGIALWREAIEADTLSGSDRVLHAQLDGFAAGEMAALDARLGAIRLVLPDDQEPLDVRAESLANWCQGFLFGLANGGLESFDALPDDATEILHDMSAFTRAGGEEDDEASEAAYAELVEYIRVGVQVLFEEFDSRRGAGTPTAASVDEQ